MRFIPTYMGNAPIPQLVLQTCSVHPHVHGERSLSIRDDTGIFGSSPRTWGTQGRGWFLPLLLRFIPTYMGNATAPRSGRWASTVHPHVHGERPLEALAVAEGIGSSPRTWGTHVGLRQPGELHRFIPTYMGNASGVAEQVGGDPRFIPTYMGNAQCAAQYHFKTSVHPHVHGERSRSRSFARTDDGSSPRTWGTPPGPAGVSGRSRFIPTYMGNARSSSAAICHRPVHPHVHGERSAGRLTKNRTTGSSPRTWGTHPVKGNPRAGSRFIPTYMGNACRRRCPGCQ